MLGSSLGTWEAWQTVRSSTLRGPSTPFSLLTLVMSQFSSRVDNAGQTNAQRLICHLLEVRSLNLWMKVWWCWERHWSWPSSQIMISGLRLTMLTLTWWMIKTMRMEQCMPQVWVSLFWLSYSSLVWEPHLMYSRTTSLSQKHFIIKIKGSHRI